MPRKDRDANRAGRAHMTHEFEQWIDAVTAGLRPAALLRKRLRDAEQDGTAEAREKAQITIAEWLSALDTFKSALDAADAAEWNTSAAAACAGASQDQIRVAAHVAPRTVVSRFQLRPIARARGVDFTRDTSDPTGWRLNPLPED